MDATAVALPLHPFVGELEQFFNLSPKRETIEALDGAGQLSLVLIMPGSAKQFQVEITTKKSKITKEI